MIESKSKQTILLAGLIVLIAFLCLPPMDNIVYVMTIIVFVLMFLFV